MSRREPGGKNLAILMFLNGVVLTICFWYCLIFIPLLPFGFMLLIFMLMGILPLTPYLSFWGAWILL